MRPVSQSSRGPRDGNDSPARSRVRHRWGAVAIVAVLPLVLNGCRKDAATADEPAAAPAETEQTPEELPVTHVHLKVVDQTTEAERPTQLGDALDSAADAAAKKIGYTLDPNGHKLLLEVFYSISVDGKPDPKAQRGQISWGVGVTLRLVDEQGLAEEISGRRGDERPFVRGALPDLKKAFTSVLTDAMEGALRDVRMQVEYRDADSAKALTGLKARHPEERWSALRRLGELGDKDAVPQILALLEDGPDPPTLAVVIGVLGRLRDPRALKLLAKQAQGPNPDQAVFVAQAIAAIGGPEAKKYLRLLEASHPVDAVRQAIEEMLATVPE